MNVRVMTVVNGVFSENCYLIWEPEGRCIILDPGDEPHLVVSMAREMELKPVLIAATHAHIDFVGAVAELRDTFRIPFMLHSLEEEILDKLPEDARLFGLPTIRRPQVDRWLADGEQLSFGDSSLLVTHTPGHTPGSVCYTCENMVFTGDTLFAGGYGRSDLEGGEEETLLRSVRDRLFSLEETTIIYPGHGPTTTIGQEKKKNWIATRFEHLDASDIS
jgi:glyoxylase-like metal-dependent hydrolase (beta-lactamase superfamily II)